MSPFPLSPAVAVLAGAAGLVLAFAVLWGIARARQDAGIVDAGWTFGLGALAVFYAAVLAGDPLRRALVAGLVLAWSLRLGLYLVRDRIAGKEEDGRYRRLRREWGARANTGFFWFFQAQAAAAVVFSVPFVIAMRNPTAVPTAWDAAGIAVWLVAVAGETVADRQLERFRADPANRGRTCRSGLWSWSRHPNYFFEWLHWWSYVLLAIGGPHAWIAAFAPMLMLYTLFRITGIPATEARALETRGDDYRDYQRTTSVFLPLPRKRR